MCLQSHAGTCRNVCVIHTYMHRGRHIAAHTFKCRIHVCLYAAHSLACMHMQVHCTWTHKYISMPMCVPVPMPTHTHLCSVHGTCNIIHMPVWIYTCIETQLIACVYRLTQDTCESHTQMHTLGTEQWPSHAFTHEHHVTSEMWLCWG